MRQKGRGTKRHVQPQPFSFLPVVSSCFSAWQGSGTAGWHLHSMNFKLDALLSMQSKTARAVEMATAASRLLSPFQQDISLRFTAAHAPGDKTTTTTVILYEGSERAE